MCKLQHFGVQIQAFGFPSIEFVAYDGAVQSERVGGMHPKLVGASGAGIKGDTGTVVLAFQYFKVCYGGLAISGMHYLPGGGRAGSGITAVQPFPHLEKRCLEATQYSVCLHCGF